MANNKNLFPKRHICVVGQNLSHKAQKGDAAYAQSFAATGS